MLRKASRQLSGVMQDWFTGSWIAASARGHVGLFGMPDMLTVTEDCQRPILMAGSDGRDLGGGEGAKDSNSGRKAGKGGGVSCGIPQSAIATMRRVIARGSCEYLWTGGVYWTRFWFNPEQGVGNSSGRGHELTVAPSARSWTRILRDRPCGRLPAAAM